MLNDQRLGFLVYDVNRLLRRDFVARVGRIGLTPAQWRVLAHLSRMEGCRQSALADTLEVRPITAGRLVERLQNAGLVRRRQDPGDRRAFQLHLTPKSRTLLRRLAAVADQTETRTFDGISAADRRRVLAALGKMRDNLQGPPRRVAS